MSKINQYKPEVQFSEAERRANQILDKLSLEDKIKMISGHNFFFIKGNEKFNIPELYLSDASQGIHIRNDLSDHLELSTAFPSPICLAATWNKDLAYKYAESIGQECRAGGIAVLLGPGMNIYRISQCGRNFEYFGEDPFLASRMVENYVTGLQSTGTMATLKHFLCNNTDFRRRTSNSIVDERTLHEIYMPAFRAGIDAGAMAVMTSYNMVNGEWTGQSEYVIKKLLRKDLGFKWLVMTDWWSVYDPEKVIKSGQDLDMPGDADPEIEALEKIGDVYLKSNADRLLKEGKISEDEINRMAASILRTTIAMGFHDRPVKDKSFLKFFPEHKETALQTAREGIVLLKNRNNFLPIKPGEINNILLTGDYADVIINGGGSAEVEGYDNISMYQALKKVYGSSVEYIETPEVDQIKNAGAVIVSIGTADHEGWDRSFNLPRSIDDRIIRYADLNPNIVVVVNSGGGINMLPWNDKAAAVIHAWYPGQIGSEALAEIISGTINPSGKLPFTLEKRFEDSPGYPYIPEGDKLYEGWDSDMNMEYPVNNIKYDEGVFVGYRWYEKKNIEPLYPFGHGLSYTTFDYSGLSFSKDKFNRNDRINVTFTIKNSGATAGAEIVQLYLHDREASVPRPLKELKGFEKVFLEPGEGIKLNIDLEENDFAYWDENKNDWYAESGEFEVLIGSSSRDIRLKGTIFLSE